MHVFICENSIDGIFSGVYDAWASRCGHRNVELTTSDAADNLSLFCEYCQVAPDLEKSAKVARTLTDRLGPEVYHDLCQAISALETPKDRKKEMNKADAVYKTIVLAFSLKDGSKVMNYLGEPYVNRVFTLCRSTENEAHHTLGFLRFSELENGILFSRIHPKHQILPLLAEHFTDRLPLENFMIYDAAHKTAAIHKSGKGYILAEVPQADEAYMTNYSGQELEYRKLWIGFFNSIAVEARVNPKLQRQNFPKRFWQDAVELQHKT